jgi:hypothetical protein
MPPNASDTLQVEVDEDPPRGGGSKLLGNDGQLLGQMTKVTAL